MPIPKYDEAMSPIITILSDNREHTVAEIRDRIAQRFEVTDEERDRPLPSTQAVRLLDDRVHWALYYLSIAGLTVAPRKGVRLLTAEGRKLATDLPAHINKQYLLDHFPATRAYFARLAQAADRREPSTYPDRRPASDPRPPSSMFDMQPRLNLQVTGSDAGTTPQEQMDSAAEEIRGKLVEELRARLAKCDPTAFESIVTRLLVRMGYAESEEDILQLHGKSGDGGIDGIVKRDPLGLEQVYMQAKRWASPVPLKPVVEFFEVVERVGVRTGVFVARSGFNGEATDWINDPRHPKHRASIAWLDGNRLAELMVKHRIGVSELKRYTIDGIDENAFELPDE